LDFVEFCKRGGLHLEPFQKRIYRAISGPERECVVLLPRDNGKSQLVAAVAVWWLLTGTESVFCAATSHDQAHLVLTYAKRMARELGDEHLVERSHDLRWCPDPKRPAVWDRQLRALPADAPKLHGLKGPWILDELHAAKDDDVYLAARTSSERASTKLVVVSTAAATADSTLGKLRARALASADIRRRGAVTDARGDNIRLLEWSVDAEVPIDDMGAAKAANPASWISRASLKALRDAEPESAFRRFHRNEHATASEAAWIAPPLWSACRADYEIERGEKVWVGVDVGGTRSLSSVCWVTADLRVGVKSWRGEESVLFAEAEVERLAAEHSIVEVAFDPWHFGPQALDLGRRGLTMVEFPQRNERMTVASARLHAAVSEGRLKHPGDPDLDRAAMQAVAKQLPRGWRIDRPKCAHVDTDPLIALAIAVDRAEAPQPEGTRIFGYL
jgi:phage terminase large subunit-like protein